MHEKLPQPLIEIVRPLFCKPKARVSIPFLFNILQVQVKKKSRALSAKIAPQNLTFLTCLSVFTL
jgi:hypothetical protein